MSAARVVEVQEIGGYIKPSIGTLLVLLLGELGRRRVEVAAEFLRPLAAPLLGMPDEESIKSIYRLTGTPLPQDPRGIDADLTPFGMKCVIPVVPFRPDLVRRATDLVARAREEFILNVKCSFFGDGRTLVTIHFRADDEAQVRRAESCEASLWSALCAAGFLPYRASVDQMARLMEVRPGLFRLTADLNRVLDPQGVIAPGRYCARGSRVI